MSILDFNTTHLAGKPRQIADAICTWLATQNGRLPDGGGCVAFHTPADWAERGEKYGLESLLILCHDGGDLHYVCNRDAAPHATVEAFTAFLATHGVIFEQQTGWYSAIFPIDAEVPGGGFDCDDHPDRVGGPDVDGGEAK